jgi:YD repeat-containing protein
MMWEGKRRSAGLSVGAVALAASGALVASSLGASSSPAAGKSSASSAPGDASVVRELTELRTATSNTVLRSDGSRELNISTHPVNYQTADGKWAPIEDRLAQASDGSWHPAASPVPVSLPSSLASGAVSIGSNGNQLSFALQGASSGHAAVAGAQRTYNGVLPGVSVAYSAGPDSVREVLTLASTSAPTTYTYKLSYASGLHPSLLQGGGVVFRDGSGKPTYTLAAPSVTDSSTAGQFPATTPVHYTLSSDGSILSLVLDKTWLADPKRVFPIKIDPDSYFGQAADCAIVNQGYANTSLCGGRLYVGANTETPKRLARALLRFNLTSIPRNSIIISTGLKLWFEADTTTSPIEFEAYGLTRDFTQSATWNSYNGTNAWTSPGGDYSPSAAGNMKIYDEWKRGWVTFGFSPLVEQWVQEPSSNHGILLKARNETVSGYDTFVQTNNHEGLGEPNMHIIYEPRLGTPSSQLMVSQAIGNGAVMGVNAASGNLNVSNPDVRFESTGYNTTLARAFNSQDDNLKGSAFGNAWHQNMGEDTLLYPTWWDGANYFHQPDGSYTRFDHAPWADGHPSAGDLAFTAEPGIPATLVVHSDETRTLTYNNTGVEWRFDKSGAGFPQQIVDSGGEGNTISLSYTQSRLTRVSDTHGHTLTLTRDPSTGSVTKITREGESTAWEYGYNGNHQLTSYHGPEGQKAEYAYDSGGSLIEIADPTGTYVITYDTAKPKRVAALRRLVNGTLSTVGSEDQITSFTYASESSLVKYPNGTERTYHFDPTGNLLEDTGTQEGASEFYSSYAGISAGAAAADVALQDRAAGLDGELSQQLGGNYVGEWFDPASGHVKIGISSGAYEQTVRQDLNNAGLSTLADIVSEKASWAQLTAARDLLSSKLASLVEGSLVRIGIRPEGDAVTVTKATSLTSAQSQEVSEAVGAVTVPTQVTEASAASVGGTEDACSPTLGQCSRPLRGGVEIQRTEASARACTAGFIARSIYDKKPYVLTAGHCVQGSLGKGWQATGYENILKESESKGEIGAHLIGNGHSYVHGKEQQIPGGTKSEGDAGLIAIDPKHFWGERPLEPLLIVYGSSEAGTTANERYEIVGTHYSPSEEWEKEGRQHFVVCTGGVTEAGGIQHTVEACGITQGLTDVPYPGHTVRRLEVVNMCNKRVNKSPLQAGTSGAPVYKAHYAYGIHSGGDGGCLAYYEGINKAEYALHVHILKDPGS